ncbi:hypothetical protein [Tabrizicola sp.]|uniref:hypothetical protein n=1 Tax=Tabrizicola sp. TaxID=2005166 RepID=UPI00286B6BAD|nr:hypothetical protein [Tabrizicola sp.]
MLVDAETDKPIEVDRWDSCGVGKGRFAAQGGLVDPNCLMVDTVICAAALGTWANGGSNNGGHTADRNIFSQNSSSPSRLHREGHSVVPDASY